MNLEDRGWISCGGLEGIVSSSTLLRFDIYKMQVLLICDWSGVNTMNDLTTQLSFQKSAEIKEDPTHFAGHSRSISTNSASLRVVLSHLTYLAPPVVFIERQMSLEIFSWTGENGYQEKKPILRMQGSSWSHCLVSLHICLIWKRCPRLWPHTHFYRPL